MLSKAYSSLCWSKDVVALRSVAAASPAQVLGPLALSGDSYLDRVKSPELLFFKQVETPIWAMQRPVGPLWHPSPVRQPAGVVGLLVQSFDVQHRVAGALEDNHVTQRGVIEGTVRVTGQPQITAPLGETCVQLAAGVAPHPLPCHTRNVKDFKLFYAEIKYIKPFIIHYHNALNTLQTFISKYKFILTCSALIKPIRFFFWLPNSIGLKSD